jgi:transcriptional regulator with XRE-family HTH domain
MTVGERIKQRRQELGWTQDKLAQQAGLSKGFLSDVESGKRDLGAGSLFAIAAALGTTMDFLMKGGKIRPPEAGIQIPGALSQFAQTAKLTFSQTLTLLELQRQIIAHRSTSKSSDLERVDWKRFYESVKEYLS